LTRIFRLKNIIITEKRVPTFVSQGISLETGGLDLLITTREAAFRAFRIQPALKKFLFVRTPKTKTCKMDSQKTTTTTTTRPAKRWTHPD
jgi:hypothetical protein